jgi:hypothetical protein
VRKASKIYHLLTIGLIALIVVGCSSDGKLDPDRTLEVYNVSFRQTAPQPTYKRTTWVLSPENIPAPEAPFSSGPAIFPVYTLNIKNSSIRELMQLLSETSRYASFCEGKQCNSRISINAVGTVEELAQEITKRSNVNLIVDHDAHEIRIEDK